MAEETNDKKFLVDYYSGLYNYFRANHNHKEIAAWGGLVLHILLCTLLTRVPFSSQTIPFLSCFLIIFILGIALIVYRYIQIRLDERDEQANFGHAALYLLNEILKGDKKLDFLAIENEESPKLVLPEVLTKEVNKRKGTGEIKNEIRFLMYSILGLSTLSVILFICI